ncbi:hypothetical protein AUJ66_06875 [Candidatus Desantisbacteria bacterium CG1_02_38_46]|uniref:Antitoxin n=2 Tax=unclassified Candidatus Desantisiibacteriota TaxID=3106372 RepID=A0A2H9PCB6_9BACT|nr:MAG: hypothetical protein AUJ66_06875 [Candidatus Desantisbacteria bacterium CG1_02_38_46]PIZ15903.1 MAG: hypothetical protein COY51_04070 [Candidatus Desantisbacteria bacterium CG_4_10_14_0_8_um_filter_39_17]
MFEERITIDEQILHGKPVIKGTRIPVQLILGSLVGGMTFEEIEKEYRINREDILAAMEYAAESIEKEEVFSLKAR